MNVPVCATHPDDECLGMGGTVSKLTPSNYTRLVVLGDSLRIWEIRNHPLNRIYANNKELIPFEAHDEWFTRTYFGNTSNRCFVAEIDGTAQAFCRFDLNGNTYAVSIMVDPLYRGLGIGSALLKESLKLLQTNISIVAEVHKDNIRSVMLFIRNDFKLFDEDNISYYFKL